MKVVKLEKKKNASPVDGTLVSCHALKVSCSSVKSRSIFSEPVFSDILQCVLLYFLLYDCAASKPGGE